MKKILILSLACLLMLGIALSTEKRTSINISWQEFFPDLVEKVYVFVKDATVFRFTSNDETGVYLNAGSMEEDLKKYGYKIEDIEVVIHNHFKKREFSDRDVSQYRRLKKCGFNGRFLLYCHMTKKVYNIEKNK